MPITIATCVLANSIGKAIFGELPAQEQQALGSQLSFERFTEATIADLPALVSEASLAKERGLKPLARFVAFATAGVEPERFGIGPVPAIRKVLKIAGLTLDQIGLIELNEAFAAQVLAVLKDLPIPLEKVNVNGGSIALGHPIGCTGTRIIVTLLYEMRRRQAKRGLATLCVSGGMGMAMALELC